MTYEKTDAVTLKRAVLRECRKLIHESNSDADYVALTAAVDALRAAEMPSAAPVPYHCPECKGGIAHGVFCSQKALPKKPNDCTFPDCTRERKSFSLFCGDTHDARKAGPSSGAALPDEPVPMSVAASIDQAAWHFLTEDLTENDDQGNAKKLEALLDAVWREGRDTERLRNSKPFTRKAGGTDGE